ncbi:amino acid ABC transporter substrate-binding protein [Gammaproteobacteria bacterium PRO6]|nr:amino acid ABC transporter substrate-binding protein [Gammaproteobacteria bacterium PRO6]
MLRTVTCVVLWMLAWTLCQAAPPAPATPAAPAQAAPAADKPAARRGPRLPVDGVAALSRIEAQHTLRVGVALNAPWVMHDKDGQLFGYSIDVARKLAADMDWKLELVETSWPGLFDDLRTNRFDVAIAGISITPQRARRIAFSQPTGEFAVSLVANRAKLGRQGVAGLKADPQRRIAVHKDTLTAELAKAALPAAQWVEFDDDHQAIADLRDGKVDALVAEAPLPELLARAFPKRLQVSEQGVLARTAHGIALRRGETALRDVLDAWVVQAQASGWLKARAAHWFEQSAWLDQL